MSNCEWRAALAPDRPTDSKIGQEKMAGNDNINIQPDEVKNSISLVSNFSVISILNFVNTNRIFK